MEHHWRAFSFVDQINAVEPGRYIRGSYTVPADLEEFPLSLAGEAVGQLASWAAMAAAEFQKRPVAGIAGCVEFLAPVRPGQVLKLSASLETVDAEAASYSGMATVDGVAVIRLERCLGPMLPVAELDDPQEVRDRFKLLCDRGAQAGVFSGLPVMLPARDGGEFGQMARATLAVPEQAPFFADHFPRRPVFPGSLLLDATLRLAGLLAAELSPVPPGGRWQVRSVSDVKFRAFVPPGGRLELNVRRKALEDGEATLAVEARSESRLVGAARVHLHAGSKPKTGP